jgi:phosphatidylserine/phosphatidylglycerophosphate/cardiolipin synthase-like enzyme
MIGGPFSRDVVGAEMLDQRYRATESPASHQDCGREHPPGERSSALAAGAHRWAQRVRGYIHTKYILINSLGRDPLVITGSANFSNPSTTNNDENMLLTRGDTRVANIYLSEYSMIWPGRVSRPDQNPCARYYPGHARRPAPPEIARSWRRPTCGKTPTTSGTRLSILSEPTSRARETGSTARTITHKLRAHGP